MTQPTCSIPDCDKPSRCLTWCKAHYTRYRRNGSPTARRQRSRPIEERVWDRVDKTGSCWLWTGYKHEAGYGVLRDSDNRPQFAHRVVYRSCVGPIPDGMEVDHKCRTRACVNPDHLRAVTRKQNVENHGGPTRRNKTGVRGVCFVTATQRFLAQVQHNNVMVLAKEFDSLAEAEAAVMEARLRVHTHNDLDRSPVA